MSEPIEVQQPGAVMLTLIAFLVVTLTFGLGSTLDREAVETAVQRKLPPIVGIACQYVIMPVAAIGLSQAFQFSPAMSIGLLTCGIVPGGATSNLLTYFIGGNVSLSIFMTVCSVAAAICTIPLLLWIFGTPLVERMREEGEGELDSFEVPYGSLVQSLLLVLLPTLGGIYLRSKSELWAKRAEVVGSAMGVVFIVGAMLAGILDNLQLFTQASASIWIASASLSVIGFGCGTLLSRAFGIDWLSCLVIGLEVGVQNTTLSISMVLVTFATASPVVRSEAILFPLMCSFWDITNSVILLIIVQLKRMRDSPAVAEQEADEEDGIALSSA